MWQKVAKLTIARFIREIDYSTWLSTVVMVKKPNRKWRMCTNYTIESSVPQGRVPTTKHWLPSRSSGRTQDGGFSRCLFWLQSYKDGSQGWGENDIHHWIRKLLLQSHAIRTKKWQSHVSSLDAKRFLGSTWTKPGSLCERHGGQIRWLDNPFGVSRRSLSLAQKAQHKPEPWEICLRGKKGKVFGIHAHLLGEYMPTWTNAKPYCYFE